MAIFLCVLITNNFVVQTLKDMHRNVYKLAIFINFFLFFSYKIFAQNQPVKHSGPKQTVNYSETGLFGSDSMMHIKLAGRLNELFTDRKNNMVYHPLLLQYEGKDSNIVSISIKAKARGNFRRLKENCKWPPIMLNFPPNESAKNSIFRDQHKLKLVVPCQGDEYVVKEWLVYKLYNLITEKSFRARLVQVEFEDSLQQRKTETYYCILLEDEKQMAQRDKAELIDKKMIKMEQTNIPAFTKMAVFQYMIGNTDWSVPYLQNIKLLSLNPKEFPYAVPYDFDHAGIVNAPYAGAAPELEISSILERVYRGYCNNDQLSFAETFELFNKLKDNFYNVYKNCPLLSAKYVKFVTKFLDDFYKTINNTKSVEAEFKKPCTTNIRIELKGLKD
ncbi:MAG: hypothetical protein M3015_07770 [Bacteroidota bacterium]|nr:hypothetical protein [Bacteroidota bacterium]